MNFKKLFVVMTIAAACVAPVLADSYSVNSSLYAGGVMVGDDLVIPVTNGAVLGLTAENIVLVPIGSANDTTNTITVRTPFQKLGTVNIRVSTGATNLVKIANVAGSLDLGTDWISDAGGALTLKVSSTALASRLNAGQAVPVLTLEPAAITATATVQGTTLSLRGIDESTNAVLNVTNVVIAVANGGVVLTNITIALP